METDENSSVALGAGEHGWGSHQLQSPGSVRRPLVESECTGNCNRSNCGFLLDVNADANMVCVPVDDDMEGENVQLRRGVRERKRTSNGQAQKAKKPRPAAAEEDKENFGAAASIPVFGESGSSNSAFREGHWPLEIHYIILPFLLENATSLLEKTREVTSPGPWPLI